MNPVSSPPITTRVIEADVVSWGTVRAWPEQLAHWRKQPTPIVGEPFSPSLIRHSEDQAVAALWATCEAAAAMDVKTDTFARWGVVAAPRLMGRAGIAVSLERFRHEGPWGISPQMIPHQSLHAISGTISQIFKIRGPNFGVGNGPRSGSEGWLTAATLLSDDSLPGLWLVIVGHTGEYLPKAGNEGAAERLECEAIALALTPSRGVGSGLRLRICADESQAAWNAPEFTLSQMVDEFNRRESPPGATWRLPGAGWIEVEVR